MILSNSQVAKINGIQSIVSRLTGIRISDINSTSRKAEFVRARQLSMYFCRYYTDINTLQISVFHGKGNHGTVLHACKSVDADRINPKFDSLFNQIKNEIRQTYGR